MITSEGDNVERGSGLDAPDLSIDREHLYWLEPKHTTKKEEIRQPLLSPTPRIQNVLDKLNVSVSVQHSGQRINANVAEMLTSFSAGVRRLGQRGLLTGDFSTDYVISTAGREAGVAKPFVDSLQPDVRARLIKLAQVNA